jgi:hypothetical protein
MFSSIYQLSKMSLVGQYIFSSNLPHLFALRKKLVYDCQFKASSERSSIWNKIILGQKNWNTVDEAEATLFAPAARVARVFLLQHTKTVKIYLPKGHKIYQMAVK